MAVRIEALGTLRNGVNFNQSQEGLGLPVVKVKDFGSRFSVRDSGLDELDPGRIAVVDDLLLRDGDTLIIRSNGNGELVGRCLYVQGLNRPITFSGFCIRFRPDPEKVNPKYATYLLRSPLSRQQMVAFGSGTGIQNLNQQSIGRIEVALPSLDEQHRIVSLLGCLDDKIELNERANRQIELLVSTLFRTWFVDFDAVASRRDGKTPIGIPSGATDLFPSHFQDSELGPIPQGWIAGRLGDSFEITMGQSPPGSTYNEVGEGLPFYQGRTDFGFRFPGRRVYCTAPTRFADVSDTLVSVRAPVGDANMASERCAIGRGVAAVRHKGNRPSFTYYAIRSLRDEFDVFESEGTLFGAIGGDDFRLIRFAHPPDPILRAFEELAAPMDALLESNERESLTLAELRDTLLGPLISGELTIKAAEKSIGAAV